MTAIDVTDQVLGIVRGIVGNAYRAWPRKAPEGPYAIVDLISRTVEQVDDDGSEVRVRLTYSVGIFATPASTASSLANDVISAMAGYNFHNTGFSGLYEDPNHLYRVNITLDGSVDRRGHTFR